jgi:TPR repeat protein/DNA polymerase III delta prime subunit
MLEPISEKDILSKKKNFIRSLADVSVEEDKLEKSLDDLLFTVNEYSEKFINQHPNSEVDFLLGYLGMTYGDAYGLCVKKAFQHINKANKECHIEASILLAQIYLGGWNDVLKPAYIKVAGEYEFLPKEANFYQPSKGAGMLRKLAQENHPYALYLYAEYLGTDHNACEEGDDTEKYGLGVKYRDEEQALEYVDKCIKAQFIGGYYLKGLWLHGEGPGEIDQKKAVEIWEEAYTNCSISDLFSIPLYYSLCYALGYSYILGEGCKENEEKGIEFIKRAADGGDEQALEYFDGDYDEGKSLDSPLAYFARDEGTLFQSDPSNFNINDQGNGFYVVSHPDDDHKPPIRVRIHHPEEKNKEYDDFFNLDEDQQDKLLTGLLEPIDRLPGLCSIKSEVKDIVQYALIRMKREEFGLKTKMTGAHMLFVGNPGTGKTLIARLIGNIFFQIGKLKKGHVVEADSSVLTGEYVGWTSSKTNLACHTALDGVLFIDEAYALTDNSGIGGYDSGIECVNTLMKFMEDFSDRLIVVAAGYKDKMDYFIKSNPGLRSRFSQTIEFEDYKPDDMLEIFHLFAKDYDYTLTEEAQNKLLLHLKSIKGNDKDRFANARGVRNLFDSTVKRQSKRLIKEKALDKEKMMEIIAADIPSDKTILDGNVSYLPTDTSAK